ncbi:tyrosine-protein phosphatase [Leucobacter massiliensis]|uniref:Tyrosine specific protein phosphatases domain-containing protein n=1 Tax=Leucobacter massiliensis TaxID=1686285 RepID=A0A2S9QSM1_9MICO|nr:tyrosine-protein phosphatase [Leucobacter massiliensis]PRI12594.1 hypothetical protein B4915_00570 [Leucobacter massiliensis]
MQLIRLDGSYNARGIGAPERPWLVRSAALDGLTASGERTLRGLGVDLVIDLREPQEHGARAHGLAVRELPLYGEAPPRAGTLEDVYARLIRDRGERLAAAVAAIAEHPGTVAVHCTAGKDRTGLVVALARLAAGEARAEILADYAASGVAVRAARSALVADQIAPLRLSREARREAERLHLDSPAAALGLALEQLDALGGAERYLLRHGATPAQLAELAARAAEAASHAAPDRPVPAARAARTAEPVR